MQTAKIFKESWEVESRLAGLGIKKSDLIQVALKALTMRNESVSNDPNNAPGLLAYIYGTREIRERMLPNGWQIDRTDNIEATINRDAGIKIIYQNTDSACDPIRDPKAISGKGVATERMVDISTGFLFPEMEEEARKNANTST